MPIVGINSTPNIPGGVGIRPLSKYWTHEQIASEAMVLTNTIDNENIQLDNVRNHINAGISYLAGLLNLAASPWYGVYATFCFEPVLHNSGLEYLDLTDSVNNRANDISNMLFSIDRINMKPFNNPNPLAPSSTWNGNVIKEDIAQLTQLNTQQNIQWRHSVAWAHHGQDLLFYIGNNIQTANRPVPVQTDYTLFCNTGLGGGQMFANFMFTDDWANPTLYTTAVNGNSVTLTYIGTLNPGGFEHGTGLRTGIQMAIDLGALIDNTGEDKIYFNGVFPTLAPADITFSGTLNTLTLTFNTSLADGNYTFLATNKLQEWRYGVRFSIVTSVASYNNFVLWAYRLPLLDNLIAPTSPATNNNYRAMVDLPDRYVDLLIKIVMQKILAQIREQIPMQLEQEINQGVATITGMLNQELQFEAAEREKRKYGAQQKAPGAVG